MGSTMGNISEYREIVQLLGRGHLRPTMDSVYSLDDGLAAFQRLQSREQMGKIAVEI
jgi:zinc-binding alcohol dehydrogenase/oxidoreductase